MLDAVCTLPDATPGGWVVQILGTKDHPTLRVRIVAMRKSAAATAFKRLKNLIHIDELRAFDPDLAQTYLLAKLLGAVLVDALRTHGPDFSPYGFPVQTDIQRRLAYFPNDLAGSSDNRPGLRQSE